MIQDFPGHIENFYYGLAPDFNKDINGFDMPYHRLMNYDTLDKRGLLRQHLMPQPRYLQVTKKLSVPKHPSFDEAVVLQPKVLMLEED